jgi:hypothetical protein
VLRSPPSHTIDDERTAATNLRPVEGGEASTAIEDEAADDGGTTLLQPPLTPSSAPKNPTPGREWEAPPPEKTKRPQRHRRPNFHHRWQSWRQHWRNRRERPIERRSSADFLAELLCHTVPRHHPPASVADGSSHPGRDQMNLTPQRTLHRGGGPKGSCKSPERVARPPLPLEKRTNKANPRQRKKQASRSNLQLYMSTREAGLSSPRRRPEGCWRRGGRRIDERSKIALGVT